MMVTFDKARTVAETAARWSGVRCDRRLGFFASFTRKPPWCGSVRCGETIGEDWCCAVDEISQTWKGDVSGWTRRKSETNTRRLVAKTFPRQSSTENNKTKMPSVQGKD